MPEETKIEEDDEVSDEDEALEIPEEKQVKEEQRQKKPSKKKLATELSDCITICQSVKFKSFQHTAETCKCCLCLASEVGLQCT